MTTLPRRYCRDRCETVMFITRRKAGRESIFVLGPTGDGKSFVVFGAGAEGFSRFLCPKYL